jgi:hypothetical protein
MGKVPGYKGLKDISEVFFVFVFCFDICSTRRDSRLGDGQKRDDDDDEFFLLVSLPDLQPTSGPLQRHINNSSSDCGI